MQKRIQIKQTLRESEANLRRAQAVGRTGSWTLDIPRNALALSEEASRLFGCAEHPPSTMEGLREHIDPGDRPAVAAAWDEALKGAPHRAEYRIQSDGETRWISERAEILFGAGGGPISGIGTVQDITGRKRALMRLEASEQRFRALIEASAQIVWSCDARGQVNDDSPSWRAYTGQTPDEYRGLGYLAAIHPDDREAVMRLWREGAEQNAAVGYVYRLRHHSGQWRFSQARAVAIRDANGRIASWVGMNFDINDQREAENALRESEMKFHQAMHHAPIGKAIVSLEGRWIEVNPAMCKLLGYGREELLATDFQTLTHPDDLASDLDEVGQLLEGEADTYQIDKRYIHKDGHVVWAQLNVAMVRDEGGQPLYFISQVQDITERKTAELALKESERRFHAIIDASPVPLIISDNQGKNIYLNPSFAATYGYTLEDIPNLDHWWPRAYPQAGYREEVKREWMARLARSERERAPFVPMDVRVCCKDGSTRAVLATSSTLSGFAAKTSLVTLYDITDITDISQRLKTLLATASDGIHVLDESGDVVEFSDSFARMLGYSAEEAAALNVADWDAQTPVEVLPATIREIITTSSTFETKHRRKDGTVFDVEINAKGIVLDGRRLLYASSRDITERKKAERDLAESEERFDLAVRGGNDGIWDWKISTDTLFWSPRFKEILGYREHEIEESFDAWTEMVQPEDREAMLAALKAHLGEDAPYDIEYRMRHKNGQYVWLRSRGQAVRGQDGAPLRMAGSVKDINDQKRAEFRLQEALEFNDTVLLKSPLAMGVYRGDGQCVLANEALAAMAGAAREVVLGQNFHAIESWRNSGMLEACLAALADGKQRKHEMHAKSSFGKEIWATVLILPTMLNNEPHLLVQLTDQTEIQSANRALRLARDRLEMAAKAASLGIWTWEFASGAITWDERLKEIYQIPDSVRQSGLYHEYWCTLLPPEDLAKAEAAFHAALDGSAEFDLQFQARLADGSVKYIHATAEVERDVDAKPARLVGANQDITPIKRTEDELQRALNQQNVILENASVGITMIRNRVQLKTNRKLAEMFGYRVEEVQGESTLAFFPDQDNYKRFGVEAYPVIERGETYKGERQMRRKDGSLVWMRLTGKAIDSQHPDAGSIWVFEDISEPKALEDQLRKAKSAAEEASRMKSEFLANMSHEIRTPMNAVLGLSQLLLDSDLNLLQRGYLEKLHNSSQSLLGILNDILDYSKIEAGKLDLESTDFHLADVLDATAKLFSYSAEAKGLELVFEVGPDLPQTLMGDPLRIKQVINNLLGNAIKFTKFGHVKLAMKRLAQEGDRLTLQISISDTGIGMSPEQVGRLFKAFEQADSSMTRLYGGTGLGLAISKHLIGMMEGRVEVASEPGRGSVFTFTLKLAVSGASPTSRGADLKGMRTLLVEDHEVTRRIMRETMVSWGFRVRAAESGERGLAMALEAIEAGRPFDLILVDWKLPGMDGSEMARLIREEEARRHEGHRHAMVIMVTAFGRDQVLKDLGQVGFDAVLDKPVIASQLFDAVAGLQGAEPGRGGARGWNELREAGRRTASIAGAKILLVEDNPTNQLVAKEILAKMGLAVELANNGLEAVGMATDTAYDAILMDLQMPKLDGIQAARRIRALPQGRSVPIIAMTAAAMSADQEKSLAAGMNDFIAKPIDVKILANSRLRWIGPGKGQAPAGPGPGRAGAAEPFALAGFDLSGAARRLEGNWGLLLTALRSFANDFAGRSPELATCLAEGRLADARILAHTLKGASNLIGATRLAGLCARLEEELAEGRSDLGGKLGVELERVLVAIASIPKEEASAASPRDSGQLRGMVQEMLSLVSEASYAPPELVARLCAALGELGQGEMAAGLRRSMESFDYEAARELLLNLAEANGLHLGGTPDEITT